MFSLCVDLIKRNANARPRKNATETKIFVLRLILIASFMVTAAVCTSILLITLRSKEQSSFESKFSSIAERALSTMGNRFESMNLGVKAMASTYSHLYPDAGDWPNVAWVGFNPTASFIGPMSKLQNMVMLPLVRPDQISSFEEFLNRFYDKDPYVQKNRFYPPVFPNITVWTRDFKDLRGLPYRDSTGVTNFSHNAILTPSAQYTQSAFFGPFFGAYNFHSNARFAGAIDRAIECAREHNYTYASANCGMLSQVVPVPLSTLENPNPELEDMIALTVSPIFPANNRSVLTGLSGGGLSWRRLLTNVVPTFVNEVECVIQHESMVFTFSIKHGIPFLKGLGDLHDSRFSSYGEGRTLFSTGAELTYYPTQAFADEYITHEPLYAAAMLLGAFLFCTVVFLCYDLLMRREFSRRQAVLDTKRRFVRFISHEIRTPLNTVRLGLKLFEVELQNLVTRIGASAVSDLPALVTSTVHAWTQLTQDILLSSESAVEVLNDLLNYDKIEMGTLRLEFALFNIGDLVNFTCAAMQIEAQQKDVALELSLCADAAKSLKQCSVIGDQGRLAQVLRNLMSNALKFTTAGGSITISVSTEARHVDIAAGAAQQSELFAQNVPAGLYAISVKDTGAGLSPQQLAAICAEGVQFNANELQAGQGSGLGLFISKGIVEQHGGKLTVASEGLGKGVTFTVELPYYDVPGIAMHNLKSEPACIAREISAPIMNISAPSPVEPARAHSHSPQDAKPAREAPRRLLVVDDSNPSRKMLVRLLTASGYRCEQAEDGAEALKVFTAITERGDAVDAVLMDFEMPVMNGPTATKKLRELGCTCMIVGVTGNVLPDEVAFFKQQGANAVLPKPFVLEDFENMCGCRDPRDDASASPPLPRSSSDSPTQSFAKGIRRIHPETTSNGSTKLDAAENV